MSAGQQLEHVTILLTLMQNPRHGWHLDDLAAVLRTVMAETVLRERMHQLTEDGMVEPRGDMSPDVYGITEHGITWGREQIMRRDAHSAMFRAAMLGLGLSVDVATGERPGSSR